tara:strand:- start:34869 stop:35621 length:753 start_codon:yes stop_codon:yes gene_type:complete
MQFQPIEKHSVSTECLTALRRAILRGDLRAGQKLPPERRLAEQFGVNRLTLRSALAQLLAHGLVTVKQGSGYTVADVARVGGPDLLPEVLSMAREDGQLIELVSDLLNVRRALAGSVLARLAERADEEAIRHIEIAVDAFGLLAGGTAEVTEFVDADFAIVAAMVEGTGSAIMRMCLNPVITAIAHIHELTPAMYVDPSDNLAGHRLLLSWLRKPSLASVATIVDALEVRDRSTIARMRAQRRQTPKVTS